MKFLHTSDIHYGAAPDANRTWGRERAKAIKESFGRIIEACVYEKVDCLIISGGLFDGRPTEDEVREVNEAFAAIPDTRVYVIAGEDDPVFSSSPVCTFRWAENVIYNTDKEFNSLYLSDIHIEIVGASDDRNRFDPDRLTDAKPVQGCASILVISNSQADESMMPENFTYIALGGDHKPYVKRGGCLVNCGSPEPICADDTGKHGYYVGEIDDESRKLTALKFVTLPTVRYITLSVNVTPASTEADVIRNLKREMTSRGSENIYQIKLNGLCKPEEDFVLEDLTREFKISKILNFTRPDYDYMQLSREHPSDMVGFFVKEMNREDISELDRKAMNFGINALLKTADERK